MNPKSRPKAKTSFGLVLPVSITVTRERIFSSERDGGACSHFPTENAAIVNMIRQWHQVLRATHQQPEINLRTHKKECFCILLPGYIKQYWLNRRVISQRGQGGQSIIYLKVQRWATKWIFACSKPKRLVENDLVGYDVFYKSLVSKHLHACAIAPVVSENSLSIVYLLHCNHFYRTIAWLKCRKSQLASFSQDEVKLLHMRCINVMYDFKEEKEIQVRVPFKVTGRSN